MLPGMRHKPSVTAWPSGWQWELPGQRSFVAGQVVVDDLEGLESAHISQDHSRHESGTDTSQL